MVPWHVLIAEIQRLHGRTHARRPSGAFSALGRHLSPDNEYRGTGPGKRTGLLNYLRSSRQTCELVQHNRFAARSAPQTFIDKCTTPHMYAAAQPHQMHAWISVPKGHCCLLPACPASPQPAVQARPQSELLSSTETNFYTTAEEPDFYHLKLIWVLSPLLPF